MNQRLDPTPPVRIEYASIQHINIGHRLVSVDHGSIIDISISPGLDQNLAVSAFGAPPMDREAVISVEGGARCNCYSYKNWAPHLHGTHIETREHILRNPKPVIEHLRGLAFVARLITVAPEYARGLNLSLVPDEKDRVITREQVEEELRNDPFTPQVVIIRSPNDPGKEHRKYGSTNPPYPHHEVANLLVERGVEHVILDFPSADREEGELLFHRTFWRDPINDATGSKILELSHVPNSPRPNSAIVELAYIPDSAPDGWYIVYLNPIGLPGDAAPVRPLIAPMINFP